MLMGNDWKEEFRKFLFNVYLAGEGTNVVSSSEVKANCYFIVNNRTVSSRQDTHCMYLATWLCTITFY